MGNYTKEDAHGWMIEFINDGNPFPAEGDSTDQINWELDLLRYTMEMAHENSYAQKEERLCNRRIV